MGMNFEGILSELCIEEIKMFAKGRENEDFYGFALDCNAEYGEVVLCFNSVQALGEIPEEPLEAEPEKLGVFERIGKALDDKIRAVTGKEELFEEAELDHDPGERESEIKWDLGSWLYQGTDEDWGHLNESSWETTWSPIAEIIQDYSSDHEDLDRFRMEFLTFVFRALLIIEQSGVLDLLNKTEDFKTLVIDHDQTEEEAWAFVEEMRAEHEKNVLWGED